MNPAIEDHHGRIFRTRRNYRITDSRSGPPAGKLIHPTLCVASPLAPYFPLLRPVVPTTVKVIRTQFGL